MPKKKKELCCPKCSSVKVEWHGDKKSSFYRCKECQAEFGRKSWGKERKNKSWYAD